MHAVALAARQKADLLLLIRAAEVEPADVAARRRLVRADAQDVLAVADLLPDRLVVVERVAALVDVCELHRVAGANRAAVGLELSRQHSKQRRFAGAVRPYDADD